MGPTFFDFVGLCVVIVATVGRELRHASIEARNLAAFGLCGCRVGSANPQIVFRGRGVVADREAVEGECAGGVILCDNGLNEDRVVVVIIAALSKINVKKR